MHDRHVMIDIETLSTENDAAIVAIGAVEFDLDRILQQKMWKIDPRFASGRRSPSTLSWWSSQLLENPTLRSVWEGVQEENIIAGELFNWMVPFWAKPGDIAGHWIWAGPNTFDLSILKTWYQSQSMILPWDWRAGRDLTTLCRVADQLGIDYKQVDDPGTEEPHNPLSDCIHQARRCQYILKQLAWLTDKAAGERA